MKTAAALWVLMSLNGSAPPTPQGVPYRTQQECHAVLVQQATQAPVESGKRHSYACVLVKQ